MKSVIISHLFRGSDGQWHIQTNEEHSIGVAKLASQFADSIHLKEWGYAMGILHDKGKESYAFQQHIKKNSGYDPSSQKIGDYHHAFVGAKLASDLYGKTAENLLVNQIYSHHSGLHDDGDMPELKKPIPDEIDKTIGRYPLNRPPFKVQGNDFHHLSRMLFSCLVDADFLDTESFMDAESHQLRGQGESLAALEKNLDSYLLQLQTNTPGTDVNKIRAEVQRYCRKAAISPKGFYSLTVPTGGGKTLSSLLWAIKHALHNGQRRIIIAIPYTSIIVQTASILKNIFGEENVLEHHSNIDPDQIKNDDIRRRMSMAAENWDAPIVVTTNVQLFESMFSNRPADCRKLHNIANSVIILDETQTLPIDYLQPIVDALKTYQRIFDVSVLFTTASQPVLSGLIEGSTPRATFNGIENITEIIPNEFDLHNKLRRAVLKIDNRPCSYDEIAEQLIKHHRVICIVNTRKDAREIFRRLPQEGITLHLSRMMCPRHINETIAYIKRALIDKNNTIIRVVSTQLIEAGVDIDFPVVYRQEIGLDSILQAAGRCNREGRQKLGTTYVFSLAKEHTLPRGMMQIANSARLSLDASSDWFSPKTMTEYFKALYYNTASFDAKNIKDYLYNPKEIYFSTAAKEFRLIEDKGVSVIVYWKDSPSLIEALKFSGPSYSLMRKLGKYIVSISKSDFKALQQMGVVVEIFEGVFALEYPQQYDEHLGILIDNRLREETIIV